MLNDCPGPNSASLGRIQGEKDGTKEDVVIIVARFHPQSEGIESIAKTDLLTQGLATGIHLQSAPGAGAW